jgi:hypothetical protein
MIHECLFCFRKEFLAEALRPLVNLHYEDFCFYRAR